MHAFETLLSSLLCWARRRIRVHAADAVQWLREHLAASAPPFDLVCVDAFDGNNDVPTAFTDPGS